jgi:preprotein translocase subunit SecG
MNSEKKKLMTLCKILVNPSDCMRPLPYIGASLGGSQNMDTFVSVIHVITALVLIALVLVQDSKGDALGGTFGGGGSNSLLGATGATTLVQKATRWAGAVFAVTSISLTLISKNNKSVIDNYLPAATAPATPANGATPPAPTEKQDAAAAATATSSSTSSTTTLAPKK